MKRTSRMLSEMLNNLRRDEENNIPAKSFVCAIATGYKISLLIVSIVGLGMWYFLSIPIQEPQIGIIFGALGVIALLMLPTYFSYHCSVNPTTLEAEYFILCFKIRKQVLWKDIEYKIIKRNSAGDAYSIRLYDLHKKKQISFDYSIVGFGKIVRMAKNIPALKR